jgi:hypothetical protein
MSLRDHRPVADAKPRAHFLHIGKTGGTAVKSALGNASDGAYDLVLHAHGTRLEQVPPGDRFFFVLRDPVERFVSGFYSRHRQGRPRYRSPWSPEEERAFQHFDTPEALGIALSSSDSDARAQALAAMRSIAHVRDSYSAWFKDEGYFESRLDDLLAILWLPDLEVTFPQLCALLGVSPAPALPADDIGAHRNPAGLDRTFSATSRANLERWYTEDEAFLERCRRLPVFLTAASRLVSSNSGKKGISCRTNPP